MEENRLHLVFEYLDMDLKKYMDSLEKDELMDFPLVKVSSVQLNVGPNISLLAKASVFCFVKAFCAKPSDLGILISSSAGTLSRLNCYDDVLQGSNMVACLKWFTRTFKNMNDLSVSKV